MGAQRPRSTTRDFVTKLKRRQSSRARYVLTTRGSSRWTRTPKTLTAESVKGKLATLMGKADSVLKKMASTLKTLCKEADFTAAASTVAKPAAPPPLYWRYSQAVTHAEIFHPFSSASVGQYRTSRPGNRGKPWPAGPDQNRTQSVFGE
jgi:hypothetical protein